MSRDEQILALHNEGLSGAEIGRRLGLTRERVRQILQRQFGIVFADEIKVRNAKIAQAYRDNPAALTEDILASFGLKQPNGSSKLWAKQLGVSRDIALIMHTQYNQKHGKDRVYLSKELLHHEYIVLNKTTVQIASEYGYKQSNVHFRIKKLGIKKDRAMMLKTIGRPCKQEAK